MHPAISRLFQPSSLFVIVLLVVIGGFIYFSDSGMNNDAPKAELAPMPTADGPANELVNLEAKSNELLSQSSESQKLITVLNERFESLGEYYARELRGISPEPPVWVGGEFTAIGVDRDKIGLRHNGSEIKIGRWQRSPSAPKYSGGQAFQEFFQNSLTAWKLAEQFGIQFKIYSTNVTDDEVIALVVADIYGQVKINRGHQTTSLWETKWVRGAKGDDDLSLVSVSIQAQEEIIVDVKGGLLLQDCTESILGKTNAFRFQFRYGLDQWARRIPGLDVVGNQGVAIGDVNNDGFDDLYICQGHGLPNQLLVQNPDGTASEQGLEAGVDVLDETRGALIVDLDNDGDQDLVLTTDDNVILFSNKGAGKFELERKLRLGFGGQSVSAADYDQDGDLDLFVCKYGKARDKADLRVIPTSYDQNKMGGRNLMLRNDEGWNFEDVTEAVGITQNNSGYSRSAVWVDFDSDGDQDLFVANEWSSNRLYENQDGWFSDVTEVLKMDTPGQNRSVSFGEFNLDGKPDLFVATDVTTAAYHTVRDNEKANEKMTRQGASILKLAHFWQSEPPKPEGGKTVAGAGGADGTQAVGGSKARRPNAAFRPYPLRVPIFTTESSFSSAVADLNNDGLDDVLVTNGYLTRTSTDDLESFLLSEIASFSPDVAVAHSESVAKGHDVLDLVRSGFSLGANQRNRCYLSLGKLGFANFSAASGIDLLNDARAIATTDWDGDGDTDVVMTSRHGPQVRIFCNQMKTENGFLQLDLTGTLSNADAIGSRIEVYVEGRSVPMVKFVSAGSGNLQQSSKRITFGLGGAKVVQKVVVAWPNGEKQTFNDISINSRYQLTEGTKRAAELSESRFELSIKPRSLRNNFELPPVLRSVFYPPSALPDLRFQDEDESWFKVKANAERPKLAVFCGNNEETRSVLQAFAKETETLKELELDCVVVMAESGGSKDADIDSQLRLGRQLVKESGVPFRWGAASADSIEKLQLVCGEWFANQQLPQLPFAVLLDSSDRVRAFYPAGELRIKNVVSDKVLFTPIANKPMETRHGFTGRWMSPYRYTDLGRLKDRFKELGFEEDAEMLNRKGGCDLAKDLALYATELASRKENETAKVFFARAIEVDPNSVIAYIGQARLLRDVANGLPLEKEDLKITMLTNASRSYQFALDIDPFNMNAVIGKANVAIDQNRPSLAIKELNDFLEYNLEAPEVKAIMGRLLFGQKEYREAAQKLTEAFDEHPTLPYVAGDLGFLYLSAGEYKQSRKFLRLAQRLQPSDRNVIRLLAEAELVTGNYERAVELFKDAVRLHPNRVRPKNILAWLLVTSPFKEQRDADQALAIINPLLDLFGETSPATLEIYAACCAEQGDFENAVSSQEKAVTLLRNDVSTDRYSDEQRKGLMERLELYRRKRPYRSNDLAQLPFKKPGNRNAK